MPTDNGYTTYDDGDWEKPMSEQNSRPTTVSAAQFVEQDYAAKIARGECEVWLRNRRVTKVFKQDGNGFYAVDTYHVHKGVNREGADSDAILEVRWLTATDAPASTPAPESGAGDDAWSVDSERQNLAAYLSMQFGYTWNDDNSCATNVRLAIENLQRQLADTKRERDLRGQFLDRIVAIRQSFNTDSNSWLDSIDVIERQLAEARAEVERLQSALGTARNHLELINIGMIGDFTPIGAAGKALTEINQALTATPPAVDPAVAALVAALFDGGEDHYGVTGYEWLVSMMDAAKANQDGPYAQIDQNAYQTMLQEVDKVLKIMATRAAALAKAKGE